MNAHYNTGHVTMRLAQSSYDSILDCQAHLDNIPSTSDWEVCTRVEQMITQAIKKIGIENCIVSCNPKKKFAFVTFDCAESRRKFLTQKLIQIDPMLVPCNISAKRSKI